jgi:vitamin B12 transporter
MGAFMVIVAALGAGPGLAQEPEKLEPVVVTATKIETPQEQLGASVTVITEEDLRTFNHDQLTDALRPVPGVDIQRSGGPGKLSQITIRGAKPTQVQVLVDGMRVKSPSDGTFDFSDVSLDAIDRIEIVRGPQAGLYGADAIGGVVNIITKKGQGAPRASASFAGGSWNTFRETAGLQGAVGRFNFNVSASHFDSRGQQRTFDNDDADQKAAGWRLGYDFPWKGELSLSGRYARTDIDRSIGDKATLDRDPNAQQQTEVGLFNLVYGQPVFGWWNLRARYGEWSRDLGGQNPPPPAEDVDVAILDSQTHTRRRELELVNTFTLGAWNTLTIGAEGREEWGRTRAILGTFFTPSGFQRFSKRLTTTSLFAQDEIKVFDRLFVTGSLRWENSDEFEESLTPRLAGAFVIKETGTKLRATWGKGFRAPTLNELLFPGFGNPGLEPERAESYDVGFDQKLWHNRVRFGLSYFHNEFEDLIQTRCSTATGAFVCQPENVGRARTQGLESYGEVEPLDWLLLYATYTHTSTVDKQTHSELLGFPRHVWNTGLTLAPLERLSLFAQAHVSSSYRSFAKNPAYHRIDIGGTYRLLGRTAFLEGLDFTARVDNVTDNTYTEVPDFPARGLTALVGLRASFQ